MTGQIEVLVGLQPDRVFFRQVPKGEVQTQVIKLEGEKAAQAKLSEITSSSPEFSAELTQLEDGKPGLKITFKAPQEERRFGGQIKVKTGLDKPAELMVFVNAEVTGDLVVDRNFALFGPFQAERPPTFQVQVRSLKERPFKLTRAVDPGGAVEAKLSQKDKQWLAELTLTRDPKVPRGKVELYTDRADQPKLELSYSVRGAQRGLPPNLQKLRAGGVERPTLVPSGDPTGKQPAQVIRLQPGGPVHKAPLELRKAPSTTRPPTAPPSDKR